MMKLRLLLLLLLTFSAALTAAGADLERVLVPIMTETIAGAHGSLWTSELWVNVTTDAGVTILPLRIADILPIRRESLRLPLFRSPAGHPPGQFILVSSELLDDVHFNLRIRDLSRQAETWGTEIPVVREQDFATGPISLLPLPLDTRFRSTVRIYASDAAGGALRVRVTTIEDDGPAGRPLYDQIVVLPPSASPYVPPYGEIALHAVLPHEVAVARIDVEPVTAGLRFWAFASVTHNETQHVTTVSPQ